MRANFPRFVLLSVGGLIACGSQDSAQELADSVPADHVVVDASADTRSAIGIASWGIRNDSSSTVVHGYDAQSNAVAILEFRAVHGKTAMLAASVEMGSRSATLKIETPDPHHTHVIEDSLNRDPAAKAMLARMVADLRYGKARSLASADGTKMASLGTLDLEGAKPGDLVKDGACPLVLPTVAAKVGQTTQDCGSAPNTQSCQQGVAEAPQDQDQASRCGEQKCNAPTSLVQSAGLATRKEAVSGEGTSSIAWHVNGTDLGIPYSLGGDGAAVGFLFGDTFETPGVGGPGWRSPVMLRSTSKPADGIVFAGGGYAPQIVPSQHNGCNGEFTVIPNDAVTLPGGLQVLSFMSVRNWAGLCPEQYPGQWRTNYAGLATSSDGGAHFARAGIQFKNDDANSDPYQMQTMQVDGEYVYMFSVRAGRQSGPMMLQRVHAAAILDRGAYECWGQGANGWGWGNPCTSLIGDGEFGEPSVRKLADCSWAMSYLEGGNIVTRSAPSPEGPWAGGHIQVTSQMRPCLYGGFIHPASKADDLHLMVSHWGDGDCGHGNSYGVEHYAGTL